MAGRIGRRLERAVTALAGEQAEPTSASRLTLAELAFIQDCDLDLLREIMARSPGQLSASARQEEILTAAEAMVVGELLDAHAPERFLLHRPITHPMQVLAVASGQGGLGKSSLSLHLACYFALRGLKVLLLGLDPNVPLMLLLESKAASSQTIGLWIKGQHDFFGALLAATCWPGLTVLPTDPEVVRDGPRIALGMMARSEGDAIEDGLRVALGGLRGSGHDLVLVDCQTGLPLMTRAAFRAASGIIVPVACSAFGMAAASEYVDAVANVLSKPAPAVLPWPGGVGDVEHLSLVRFVPARLDQNDEAQVRAYDALVASLGDLLLPAVPDGRLAPNKPVGGAALGEVVSVGRALERALARVWLQA